jgi:hypothetical protein
MVTRLAKESPGAESVTMSSRDNSSNWWTGWWHRDRPLSNANPDARVDLWKAAWLRGANTRWTRKSSGTNPFAPGMEHSAWQAGWEWARQNPDRRVNQTVRMAHRRRRATDATLQPSVKGAVGLGVAGVTVYAISRAVRRWMDARSRT